MSESLSATYTDTYPRSMQDSTAGILAGSRNDYFWGVPKMDQWERVIGPSREFHAGHALRCFIKNQVGILGKISYYTCSAHAHVRMVYEGL